MSGWYRLDKDHNVTGPYTTEEHAQWLRDTGSQGGGVPVKQEYVTSKGGKKYWVSTVFLGLDMQFFRGGKPMVFETMAFTVGKKGTPDMGGEEGQTRCSTYAEALEMHKKMKAKLKRRSER